MVNLLEKIAAQLRHFTHEETVALISDFLAELDEPQQIRFLNLVTHGPRPRVAEAMGLDEVEDLLDEIQLLYDAIAADAYVEYGAGYDPDYGDYRGFGDDSWIDEMDSLFEAATSFFRAGQFQAAAEAYLALFDIFELSQDGFKFTRPNPAEALHTDIEAMKQNLFIAIGRAYADAAEQAIEVSGEVHYYGTNRYALLNAWQDHAELMTALEATLIDHTGQPITQDSSDFMILSHAAELLREFYRRYRTLSDYESLCRHIGPQQGWPYEEVVIRHQQRQAWEQVVAWAEDGLARLPAESHYRALLQEAQGQALLHLDRPAEAFEALLRLFRQKQTVSIYLNLRQAAQALDRWEELYPQLVTEMKAQVPHVAQQQGGYLVKNMGVAVLLGYVYLLEGDWQRAVEWATNPAVPSGWGDTDLIGAVAAGLLQMGLSAYEKRPDEMLAHPLRGVPPIIQEHGTHLESAARTLPPEPLLDSAVQLYERLVERAINSKNRTGYAEAGSICKVIQAIRSVQGRQVEFDRYYQGLFMTYARYSALKDELRKAIEGQKRRGKNL